MKRKVMEIQNPEQLDHDDGDGPETITVMSHSNDNVGTIDDSSNIQSSRLMESSDGSTLNNNVVISHLNTSFLSNADGVKSCRSVDTGGIIIQLGQEYDILDSSKRWCEGQVIKLDHSKNEVYVHYTYWDSKFDEWRPNDGHENIIAPLHTHTFIDGGVLEIGQRVEVLDPRRQWLEAFVIEENDNEVKVHYKDWHSKFDEWIARSTISTRFRPYGRSKQQHQQQQLQQLQSSSSSSSLSSSSSSSSSSSFRHHHHHHHQLQTTKRKQWKVPGQGQTGNSIRLHQLGNINNDDDNNNNNNNDGGGGVVDHPSSLVNNTSDLYNRNTLAAVVNSRSSDNNNINNNINNNSIINNSNIMDDIRTRRISELSSQYSNYIHALHSQHLTVVPVSGDGNCLFRAVAHQVYGDERYHMLVRAKCVDYMEVEAEFFSQFVVGGRDMFPLYLQAKRGDACWGDDPEIEAICELYNRPAEIWAYDPSNGARKLRTFHEVSHTAASSGAVSGTVSAASSGGAASGGTGGGGYVHNNHMRHTTTTTTTTTTGGGGGGGGVGSHYPMSSSERSSSLSPSSSSSFSSHGVIRLSFYGGGHYDSLVDPCHLKDVLSFSSSRAPGEVEDINISRAITRRQHREQQWLKANSNNNNNNNNNNNYQANISNNNNNNYQANSNNNNNNNRMSVTKEEEEEEEKALMLLSAVTRQSDVEATEAEAMDQMLQESRSYQLNADHDDLETCLLLSMLPSYSDSDGVPPTEGFNHPHHHPHHDWKEDKDSDDYHPSTAMSNGDMQVAVDASSSSKSSRESASKAVDMGAIDDIIQSVEKQSELEYLDAMILSQLQHGTTTTTINTSCMSDGDVDGDERSIEEQLLRQVQLESEKELLEKYDLEISMRHVAETHTAATTSPYEDSLEQALKESLLQHQQRTSSSSSSTASTSFIAATTTSSSSSSSSSSSTSAAINTSRLGDAFLDDHHHLINSNSSFQTDEEILQMALEQSLQSYSSSLRGQSNNNYQDNYHNNNYQGNNNNNYQGNNNNRVTGGNRPSEASSSRTYIIPLIASTAAPGGGDGDSSVEDMDEELMRAIEESLRRR